MTTFSEDLSSLAHAISQNGKPSMRLQDSYGAYKVDTAIAVYRNNYLGNLIDTLAGAYPVVEQLVGKDFFRVMALRYIEQHGSHGGNLHHYGAEMADFITSFEPAGGLVYLTDVAALEWACHRAYFADDVVPFDVSTLARIAPGQYEALTLHLHPACHLVESRYPLAAIWRAHQPGAPEVFHIDLDNGPSHALVTRKEDVVQVDELPPANARWLQRILAGMSLGTATAETLAHHAEFDLQAILLQLTEQKMLTGFDVKESV